jgi:hypothetical protein
MHIFNIFADSGIKITGLPMVHADNNAIATVTGIVFDVIGALAILMIVISGFRYIVSAGDAQAAAKAKNGLLYSVIGLAVAVSAEVIVQFVVGKL